MSVRMSIVVFWVMTPFGLVGGYQRFRGAYCLPTQKTTIREFTRKICSGFYMLILREKEIHK
jgi:hypothetical protein